MKKPISLVENKKGKPTTVIDYNSTKGGVDVVDRLLESRSCSRPSRRWPMAVFYHLLSIAAHNASIIFQKINPISTYDSFIDNLVLQLAEPFCEERLNQNKMTARQYSALWRCGIKLKSNNKKSGRCEICEENRMKMIEETGTKQKRIPVTTKICEKCKSSVCGKHSFSICQICFENN